MAKKKKKDEETEDRTVSRDAEAEELTLQELIAAQEEEEAPERIEEKIEFLSFFINQEEYAFNVLEVKEIISYQAITFIPRCPEYVLGVISLRGEIVPIIDLKIRMGFKTAKGQGEQLLVIVYYNGESVGFAIDGVSGVIKVKEEEIEAPPEVITPEKAEYLKGVVYYEKRLVALLNIANLLDIVDDFEAGKK